MRGGGKPPKLSREGLRGTQPFVILPTGSYWEIIEHVGGSEKSGKLRTEYRVHNGAPTYPIRDKKYILVVAGRDL